ncbi:tetratricopeptide repeat protein [Nonomuraea fuscirosea]|uniref:Tetratricopeptide repeat protein n=1 Tax=Nonomuraea fuscirosea TaxID=1291556 RepID=A0A2T0LU90_9ACTN|nr:tetratricopeptide repeat protein [Nonomuraea fuscirosea]
MLGGFLRSLGVPSDEIPDDVAERAARYRSLLADRRMLLILDNAHSTEQVRLLLPGTASCLVLVTSRDSLVGLRALHGARRIDLDVLPLEDAVKLLRAIVGPRIDAAPNTAAALAQLCACLPLALRIMAALALTRIDDSLDDLLIELTELTDEQAGIRLDALEAEDSSLLAVRTVFSWSYRYLPPDAARLFKLLGLNPGHDISHAAVSALLGNGPRQTASLIRALAGAHMIQRTQPHRITMHDLLRSYARERAAEDPEPERRQALQRLLDHYLSMALDATDKLLPSEPQRLLLDIKATERQVVSLANAQQSREWFDAERANLVAMTAYAARHGWPRLAGQLSTVMWYYLSVGAHRSDALAVHTHALQAARNHHDQVAEGRALGNLGLTYWQLGRHRDASAYFTSALAIFKEIGDVEREGNALNNLGVAAEAMGNYPTATTYYQQALIVHGRLGDRVGEGIALDNLGNIAYRKGEYDQALARHHDALLVFEEVGDDQRKGVCLNNMGNAFLRIGDRRQATSCQRQALALARSTHDRVGEGVALGDIGVILHTFGRHRPALTHHERALVIARKIGDPPDEALALYNLGRTCKALRRLEVSLSCHRQALGIAIETSDRGLEATALIGLGETLVAAGKYEDAEKSFHAALSIAQQIDTPYEQACALQGVGDSCQATSRGAEALFRWKEALALYTRLRVPEAARLAVRVVH